MNATRLSLALLAAATGAWPVSGTAQTLPRVQRNGAATQLILDGAPYLILGGELHNSSASSPAYMAAVWDRLKRQNIRTVFSVASWELVEPLEGRFDFAAVDDQIAQARARGIRIVLIWFGGFKNAESRYAPSWVRRDERRFPRAVRSAPKEVPTRFLSRMTGPAVSVFADALVQADAHAFTELMAHIRRVDRDHTVIMVQVENESGLLGDTRDRSPLAEEAWREAVPAALMQYLATHRETLTPRLLQAWSRHGFAASGTWQQVFGDDAASDEIFMAWHFGSYVERVARAGAAAYPLPMFTNAWLGPQPSGPVAGQYPSGGPVAGMLDVWKAAAPSLVTLGPDIYVDDFAGVLASYDRPDNPILIPESRPDVGNLFVAIGEHKAIAYSPFGVDDEAVDHPLFAAYGVLGGMTGEIARAQAADAIRGVRLGTYGARMLSLGGYDITITPPVDTRGAFGAGTGDAAQAQESHALIIAEGDDAFTIVARGVNVAFAKPGATIEVDWAQEGKYVDGKWIAGRTLNGDERERLFPSDQLRIVRLRLLRR